MSAGQAIPNEVFARLTQLFLDANTARMPERLERGLVALFSTIQVNGIRITLGEPPLHPDMDETGIRTPRSSRLVIVSWLPCSAAPAS